MSDRTPVWNREEMADKYGAFYSASLRIQLDKRNVPEQLWSLLPYAEFWGIADDRTRERLLRDAPGEVRRNLKGVVSDYDDVLTEWLSGPEAVSVTPSNEYIAFSAMVMAADYV